MEKLSKNYLKIAEIKEALIKAFPADLRYKTGHKP